MFFNITTGEIEIMVILLPIDAFNLYLLVKLWKWSQTAGKNLISQVVKALNLNYGNHQEKIGEAIKSETMASFAEQLPEEIQKQIPAGINIQALTQAFIRGDIKKEDIIRMAPVFLKKMKESGGENGNGTKTPGNRW